MITESIYIALIVLAVALFVYSLIDQSNRIYGNIITMYMAALLFIMLSLFSITGDLLTDDGDVIQNAPIGWLLLAFGVVSIAFGILMTAEAVIEAYRKAEEQEEDVL